MINLEIYEGDPFEGSCCGPGRRYEGSVEVARANIITNFKDFLDNWDVYQKIQKEGLSALPITKVNDRIISERGYPELETLRDEVKRIMNNSQGGYPQIG